MVNAKPEHMKIIKGILTELVPEYEVRAFGSRVNGTAKKYSDLDLALVGKHKIDLRKLRQLEDAFQESDLPFRVDILDWNMIDDEFKKVIKEKYEVIHKQKITIDKKNEWKEYKLGDIGEVNRGKSKHRPRYAEYLYGGPYPFIQTGDVKKSDGRITEYHQTYSEAGLKQSKLWPKNTLCITIAANIAETGILQFPACFPDSIIGFISNEDVCDVYFIEYLFRHKKKNIQRQASGTVQDNINLKTLDRLTFKLPPLPEQKAIAHILGTLDDKIELNRRMNRTLEGMARAVFKSWFVDFDPVIDNALAEGNEIPDELEERADRRRDMMNRRKLNFQELGSRQENDSLQNLDAVRNPLPEEIRTLFPSRFVESELGWIPEGWDITKLSDDFNITMGQSPPGKTYNEEGEGLPFYQGRRDFGFRFPNQRIFCSSPKRFANAGDTLLSVRAPVGDINMATEKCCIGRGLASIIHRSGCVSYTFYTMENFQEKFSAYKGSGTVFSSITGKELKNIDIIKPKVRILEYLGILCKPLDIKIQNNFKQIEYLSEIRDTLLPKLISGEIRVGEADKIIAGII